MRMGLASSYLLATICLVAACSPDPPDETIQSPAVTPGGDDDQGTDPDDPIAELRVQLLESEAQDDRLAAVHALSEIEGQQAVELLTLALEDIDFRIRRDAAGYLGEREEAAESAVPALGALLYDEYGYVRERAVVALSRIGSEAAVDVVRDYARGVDLDSVDQAMDALGVLASPRGIPEIEPYAAHPDTYIRVSAHRALIRIGAPSAPTVRGLLQHERPEVRCTASRSLGVVGGDEDIATLEELASTDEYPFVRACALGGLGRLGVPDAIARLRADSAPEQALDVREAAAASLGLIGSEEAIDALIDVLPNYVDPEGEAPNEATRVLVSLGARSRPQVASRLQTAEPPHRELLVEILAMVGTAAELPLIQELRDAEANRELLPIYESAIRSIESREAESE